MRRCIVRCTLVVAALAFPGGAVAWTPIHSSEPTWPSAAPYSLNENGSADLGGFDATERIVRRGMEDWAAVSCTSLEVVYRGMTNEVPGRRAENVVGWVESSWPFGSTSIGVTSPTFNSRGEILKAVMWMNGARFTWVDGPGSGSNVDTYSIVLHEAGHYFGLGHSSSRGATMYPSYGGGELTLGDDDRAGICSLYPGSGGSSSDCTTTGCPSGETCVSGTCTPARGDAGFCEPCSQDLDCAVTGARCARYPDGDAYCTAPCNGDGDCGSRSTCTTISDGSRQCVRRDSSGDATCFPEDTPSEPDAGTPLADAGTPRSDAGSPAGTDAGAPDPGPSPGEEDPGSGAVPDAGTATGPDAGTLRPGEIGATCLLDRECDSGLCVTDAQAGRSFCSDTCAGSSDCGGGLTCQTLGQLNLCLPRTSVEGERGGSGDGGPACQGAACGPDEQPDARTLTGGCGVRSSSARPIAPLAPWALAVGLLLLRRRRKG